MKRLFLASVLIGASVYATTTKYQGETQVEALSEAEEVEKNVVDKTDPMIQQVLSEISTLEQKSKLRSLSPGARNETMATMNTLKRFIDLKALVAWMQPFDKRISRYCMYGCWCLPEGAHGFVAGIGKPVDLVDKACMQLFQCYECAREAFNGYTSAGVEHICDPNTRSYARYLYHGSDPTNYEERGINCINPFSLPNSNHANRKVNCARAVCECDKWFAYALYKYESFWSKSRHRIWSRSTPGGQFVVQDECKFCEGSSCGQDHTDHDEMCCGDFTKGTRFPVRTHGGAMDCCTDAAAGGFSWTGVHYNTLTSCCVTSTVTQYCATNSGSGTFALDCKNEVMDVLFVVDKSGSVGASNWNKNLAFVADLINDLDIADGVTQVALSAFDHAYHDIFDFTDNSQEAVMDTQSSAYSAGGTDITLALNQIASELTSGSLTWRPSTKTWVVFMTDGSDVDGTGLAAASAAVAAAKGNGQPTVNIAAIAIGGNTDSAQIADIVTDAANAFSVAGYNDLAAVKESLGALMCPV